MIGSTIIDKKEDQKHKRLVKTYGITLLEYRSMLAEQNNTCFICKTLPPSGRLCIDHIHIKGFKTMSSDEKRKYVRRLLCFLCNTSIGKLERTNNGEMNRKRLNGMVEYFKIFQMRGEI